MALPDPRARGGPTSHLYLLRDELVHCGMDVRGFIYGGRTHDEGRLRKILGRLADLLRFPFLILRHRPHIVHLNSAFDPKGVMRDALFMPLARLLGQRVVIKFHGSDLDLVAKSSLFWRFMTARVVKSAHAVCLLSRDEIDAFRQRFPGRRYVLVKNALDFRRYEREPDFRRRFDIPQDKPLLLFIARFIRSKGLHEVLAAMPAILGRHDVHLACVGDGPVKTECETLARELKVDDHVTFTGYVEEDETVNAYLDSDVLVFPTYHQEGMPMVIFHSLACGLPVVTTKIRAAADWLEEGRNVLFVQPRQPGQLAEALISLLDEPERMAAMGRNNREVARGFEKSAVAGEFHDLYNSLVS